MQRIPSVKTLNCLIQISAEDGLNNWSIYQTPSIAKDAITSVRCYGRAKTGSKYLFMRLPTRATSNQSEHIHAGQNLSLISSSKRYRYSVQVKWANPGNVLPSELSQFGLEIRTVASTEKMFG